MKTKAQKPGEQNRRHFKNYAFSKENLHLFTSKHLIKTFNKNFLIVYQSCGKINYTWCEIVILIIINSCSLKAGFRYSRLCNYFIILLIPIFFWDALYLSQFLRYRNYKVVSCKTYFERQCKQTSLCVSFGFGLQTTDNQHKQPILHSFYGLQADECR